METFCPAQVTKKKEKVINKKIKTQFLMHNFKEHLMYIFKDN